MKLRTAYRKMRKGLLFKKNYHIIDLWVTFTEEEELALFSNVGLDFVLWKRGIPADVETTDDKPEDYFHLKFGNLVAIPQPDSYAFATETEATEYEAILNGAVGPAIEELIESFAEEK